MNDKLVSWDEGDGSSPSSHPYSVLGYIISVFYLPLQVKMQEKDMNLSQNCFPKCYYICKVLE